MGESISTGILAKWHVKSGDSVKRDQPLFELETDKITSEGNAEASGVITLKVEAGAEVKIGQVVASIEEGAGTPRKSRRRRSRLPRPTLRPSRRRPRPPQGPRRSAGWPRKQGSTRRRWPARARAAG